MNISTSETIETQDFVRGAGFSNLRSFMNMIWEDPAEYKVLMARRMFNLNYALMKTWGAEQKEQYLTNSIMSNTAFLLYGKVIADYYAYKKRFPRIIICDDILLHGRGIMKLLDQFKKILNERLAKNDIYVNPDKIEKDLAKALRIYVYASDKKQILIKDYYIYTELYLSKYELRHLSQQISEYLQSCGVANTSYVLSTAPTKYYVRNLLEKEGEPFAKPFVYRNREQFVYMRFRNAETLETLRLQFPSCEIGRDGILTGLVIFGDVDEERFNRLCDDISGYLERGSQYSQIAEILRQKSTELFRPRAQLVSFLYSILGMCAFYKQYMHVGGRELYSILLDSDIDKIVTNFDVGDVFRFEILRLCKDLSSDLESGDSLWKSLRKAAQPVYNDKSISYSDKFTLLEGPDDNRRKEVYERAEDILYEVGMDAEYDAFRYVRTDTPFDAKRDGFDQIDLNQYLILMKKNKIKETESIGSILGMMDSGLLSMNLERKMSWNGAACRNVMKAGELATYILPRRFAVFVPALAAVEKDYKMLGNYVQDVVGKFVDYLQDFCFAERGYVKQQDQAQLKELMSKKSLLLYIYSTGQTFQDWDIDLRTQREYSSYKSKYDDQLTYEEEWVRKRYYLNCARKYLLFENKHSNM